ncbi:DUF1343 domain-containing protein [candidate division KSB1 bacterium]|nr:DUF1343 domain-containing protein [candidate division KSB1 bacterium]RQW00879.1 MAG: DUF1343 domain-containing protein [candidate division KSB1 bacterium]
MKLIKPFVITFTLFCAICMNCSQEGQAQDKNDPVLPGIDILLAEQLDLVKHKRVGLITNPTGITTTLLSTIETLYSHPQVNLVALYAPEHGVRGDIPAGEYVEHFIDKKTKLPVYSLYGATKKPTAKMLKDVDILLFDIQDIGVRPYTYIYTMAYAMVAAQENTIPFIVLDRPNPLGGELIEGPILEEQFFSFIGLYPIPYIHGMTVGELAGFFNEEFEINAQLKVVRMQGWSRDLLFEDTHLPWVPTSPHVPHARTPFFLATTGGFGELKTLNEGVGYTLPFEYVGAEWIDADTLAETLNALSMEGVFFRPVFYKPYYGAKAGIMLHGVHIHITDYTIVRPIKIQIAILKTVHDLYPDQQLFDPARLDMFTKAIGTDKVRMMIEEGRNLTDIVRECEKGLEAFVKKRKKYLLYE